MADSSSQCGDGPYTGRARFYTALAFLWSTVDVFVKAHLAAAVLLVVAGSVLVAGAPVLLKLAIDALSVSDAAAPRAALVYALAYVVVQWSARVLGESRWYFHGRAEQRTERLISGRIFQHALNLPVSFHVDSKTGAVVQTLANSLGGYRLLLQHLVFTALPAVVELAAIVLILATLGDPVLFAVLGASIVGYGTAFVAGTLKLGTTANAAAAARVDAGTVMSDGLLNYETVKYFGAEALVHDRFDRAMAETEWRWRRFFVWRTTNGMVLATIVGASLAASMLVLVQGVSGGRLTVGDFVLVSAYMLQVIRPLELLGFAVRDVTQAIAFIDKQMELLQAPPEPLSDGVRRLATHGQGAEIVFENVTFGYQPDRAVLHNVSFRVPPGEVVAIVGFSGAGKSSLVRLLFRFYAPNSGRILMDGVPISEIPLAELRRAVSVVPQDTVLFNDSIEFNLRLARADSAAEDVEAASAMAQLDEMIAALPGGYQAAVGQRGLKLSGGEKQRVGIARAVLKRPRVLVLDEATSSLDTRTERDVQRSLLQASAGVTTLAIAHRLSTIAHASEIIVLDKGVIVERGSHAGLIRRSGRYAAMWSAQQAPCAHATVGSASTIS